MAVQPANLTQLFERRIRESKSAIDALAKHIETISAMAGLLIDRLSRGGTLYTCGNGGSAAQALHLAEELVGRYRSSRPPLRAICMNADPTALTCIANDFGFERTFARQCEALVTDVDVLLVLSTSGESPNLVAALQAARQKGAATMGLLGRSGGACRGLCDHSLVVSGCNDSAHIQELHLVTIHLICEALEGSESN